MMIDQKNNLQRYALLFGTYMGAFWILKFALFPLGLGFSSLFLLLFMGLTLCVPFIGYYCARVYRNKICGGYISFFHAWVFTLFMYLAATLLAAMGHYVYFAFIDQGFVLDTYESIIEALKQSELSTMEGYTEQLEEAVRLVQTYTPFDIVVQLMSNNIFTGSILALITAAVVMRKPPIR